VRSSDGGPTIVDGGLDDPRVEALLALHLRAVRGESPPESVHALDLGGLRSPDIRFWSAWSGDEAIGAGALLRLSASHGEVKSMFTSPAHRGRGVGAAMLRHILANAREAGFSRVSLETGSPAYFDAARALYLRHGFRECGPFGGYVLDPYSVFMTLELAKG
jgi:putative acetyltransferase